MTITCCVSDQCLWVIIKDSGHITWSYLQARPFQHWTNISNIRATLKPDVVLFTFFCPFKQYGFRSQNQIEKREKSKSKKETCKSHTGVRRRDKRKMTVTQKKKDCVCSDCCLGWGHWCVKSWVWPVDGLGTSGCTVKRFWPFIGWSLVNVANCTEVKLTGNLSLLISGAFPLNRGNWVFCF